MKHKYQAFSTFLSPEIPMGIQKWKKKFKKKRSEGKTCICWYMMDTLETALRRWYGCTLKENGKHWPALFPLKLQEVTDPDHFPSVSI